MRKSTRKLLLAAAFLLVILAAGTGCAKTGSTYTTSPICYLSLIDEASYAGPINVFLNDTLATANGGITAGTFSQKYGVINPGSYDVKFRSVSSDSLLSEVPASVFDTLNFYTLLVYNTPGGGSVQSVKIWDNFSTIAGTQANYRFFNLSPDYPNVDLYLGTTIAQQGRTTADNVANTLYNNFQALSAGSYNITAKVAGTDSVIATASNQVLSVGNAYTFFLGGRRGSGTYPMTVTVLQAAYQ